MFDFVFILECSRLAIASKNTHMLAGLFSQLDNWLTQWHVDEKEASELLLLASQVGPLPRCCVCSGRSTLTPFVEPHIF